MVGRERVGIGEAARILGTTERTLRFYEQRGVLAPSGRQRGAHRRYDLAELETARQVLSLRRLGLDLDTIRSLLADEDVDLAGALEDQADRLDARIVSWTSCASATSTSS